VHPIVHPIPSDKNAEIERDLISLAYSGPKLSAVRFSTSRTSSTSQLALLVNGSRMPQHNFVVIFQWLDISLHYKIT
jgi:hypothetical protein